MKTRLLKHILRDIVKETSNKSLVEERIHSIESDAQETERFCHEKFGMPILTEEEKKIQRKKTYDSLLKETKGKSPIDSKVLYKEVQDLITLLESDVL
jgi:hypothetical protein